MRGSTPVATTLFVVAGLMLVVSGLGLLLLARRAGALDRLGILGVLTGGLGCSLLAAAAIVSGVVDSDWEGMPGLVVPGVVLLAVGAVLLLWVVYRVKVLPDWVAFLLLGAALLVPFSNEQTSRILLAVPFGVAWFVAGVMLLAQRMSSALPASEGAVVARYSHPKPRTPGP
jgi:hypothetical protein